MKTTSSKNDKIVGRPIRLNQQTLRVKNGEKCASVMFIGDAHMGSPQFDLERFVGNINWCLKHNTYVMLMGDLLETGTRNSVGAGVYEQDGNTDSQFERMMKWLRPLAEKGLIIGVHRGNHEIRVYKDCGVDISKAMARELKAPYLGDACWNRFRVGDQSYSVYSLHGRSGSRFDGTALLAVERISTSFYADLVAHAHMHKCTNSIVLMQRVVGHKIVEHKKHLLITGGYLSYDRGYGQALGLPISKLGSPRVRFFSDRHDLVVSW